MTRLAIETAARTASGTNGAAASARTAELIRRLRSLALRGLRQMYLPEQRLFCFTVRRTADGPRAEGVSRRYTAITLLGLAGEDPREAASILGGEPAGAVAQRLVDDVETVANVGDVALTVWVAAATGVEQRAAAIRRLTALLESRTSFATVELSWALAALCGEHGLAELRDQAAARLLTAYNTRSRLFRHYVGSGGGMRAHVSCFADLVYPTQALALYHETTGDPIARETARACAQTWAALQGPAGQWWWHYDARTGRTLEPFPVYSVHQHAMGPMALFAAEDATGVDFKTQIQKSLAWAEHAPELRGRGLIDEDARVVWRKVARHEPGKLARRLQTAASWLHPSLRFPGVNALLKPGAVDYECRPYEFGWLLYAFPRSRLARWTTIDAIPRGASR